jgi:magnesium transporter
MLVLTDLETDKIEENLRQDRFFWLDLESPSPQVVQRTAELLHLHPVAVEDSIEFGQRPKVDVYDDHLLIVFYTARVNGDHTATPMEIHLYLSGGFVVTVRREQCTVLDALHTRLADQPIHDEGYLIYRILDTLTDAYYPVISDIEARVDGLEAQILLRARREQLPVIYRLRQDVRELLRIAASQRDTFPATAEAIRSLPGLAQGTREYLRDIGDHLAQVAGELSRQTDDLNALTGTYFNANADRLNAVATRLTIVGTLFIVSTLVTGFFGQNFRWLVDNISTRTDFLVFGVGGLAVPLAVAGTILWVKRNDWF